MPCLKQTIEQTSDGSSEAGCQQRGSLLTLLSRPSPFSNEMGALPIGEFAPNPSLVGSKLADVPDTVLKTSRVLVVGGGGLGCELLKNLAMSGIPNVGKCNSSTVSILQLQMNLPQLTRVESLLFPLKTRRH